MPYLRGYRFIAFGLAFTVHCTSFAISDKPTGADYAGIILSIIGMPKHRA